MLKKSALLVIDMQRYFLDKNAPAYLNPPKTLVPNIIKLINAFKKINQPIIFTKHVHTKYQMNGQMAKWWDGKLPMEGDKNSEIIDELSAKQNGLIISKSKYSAFEGTDLDKHLKKISITHTIICGVMTNLCVETTARHAFMKDFQPIIISDACTTKDKAYHDAAILNLSYGFANIRTTKDIMDSIQ